MVCLHQVWQPLREKINFVCFFFFFLDKCFVFSYSEAGD